MCASTLKANALLFLKFYCIYKLDNKMINDYKKIVLNNGLIVILYQIKKVQSVFVTCSIKSGNDYIKDNSQIGLAHFLEHLSFCSTEKYKTRKSINIAIDDIGAYANASTNIRGTNYWIKAPYINTPQSIEVLHQLIFKSVITEVEIEKEKRIVLSEYENSQINETSIFNKKIQEKRFNKLPQYQLPVIGTPEQIESFTKEMVENWKNTFYNPNNMILSVAGNFVEQDVLTQIKSTFGKEKKGKKFEFPKYGNNKYSDYSIYVQKINNEQICLNISWPVFGWCGVSRCEEMNLKILNNWLGRGPGSKLNMKLREEKGLTYGCGSSLFVSPYLGSLELHATVEKSNLKKVVGEIGKIIKTLKEKGISRTDLDRTKKSMKLHDYLSFESPESICWYLAGELFDYGEIWSIEEYAKETEKVTTVDIKKLANNIFTSDKLNINLLGNVSQKDGKRLSNMLFL